ncbi:cytochrome c-type biogenesis protein [Aeromonas simiae]|uniref:Cytochrome c-type biogenesis protein n=1 Tax=Aeromonas simiae TaxID=218936 RepID=A0A5J6WW38_9GAMM|nr:cytochrome c-type biogenesis protein CcmH [Aeromonas simiae]QFI54347.1 heme lyase NrfEFG subunit NrfF [Aeromonas simiae]
MRGVLILICLLPALLLAADDVPFTSPEQAERAEALARSLRCPTCQNQNLVESNSPLAQDLRLEVYRRVAQGQSDDTVRDTLIARYGVFVSYRPPLQPSTWLLWGGPPLLLVLCTLWLVRRGHHSAPPPVAHEAAHDGSIRDRRLVPPTAPWLLPALLLVSFAMAGLGYRELGHGEQWADWQANPDPLHKLDGEALKATAGMRLRERINRAPRDKEAWAELAQWLLYQNHFDASLWAYARLAELEGEVSAATRAARATVYYYRAGQRMTPLTQQELSAALAQDPGEVTALMLLASDHFLCGRYREAALLWQRLLDEGRPRLNREAVTRALQMARVLGG